jgi:CLIP-associating protein 1/2
MHASIRTFRDTLSLSPSDVELANGTYAFGLIALGKFILRLPKEVLEDELPRLRTTLTSVSGAADWLAESRLTYSV